MTDPKGTGYHCGMRNRLRAFRPLALLAGCLIARVASADCDLPSAEVLWSFPEEGQAVSASSQAVVVYTSPLGAPVRVLVDGQEVPRADDSLFLFPLSEQLSVGEHELQIEFTACDDNCTTTKLFAAIDSPMEDALIVPAVGTPTPLDADAIASLEAQCGVFRPHGCYDVGGPPPLMAFEIVGDAAAIANIVEVSVEGDDGGPVPFLWPVECDAPTFHARSSPSVEVCVSAYSIGKDGSVSEKSTPTCTQAQDTSGSPDSQADPESCSTVGSQGSVSMFALALLIFRRRRLATPPRTQGFLAIDPQLQRNAWCLTKRCA